MKLGLMAAMPVELAAILRRTGGKELETAAGAVFYELEDGLLACAGGIGKVNIAMATQLLIDRYHPDCIVNAGVAGSMVRELNPGDLVLAERFLQHDMDTSAIGDPVGLVSTVNRLDFPTDRSADCRAILKSLGCAFHTGSVATGDLFVTDTPRAAWIRETFHPTLCDMEGCAIAQVCLRNQTPFTALKAVSDRIFHEGDNGGEYQFQLESACEALTDVLLPFLRRLREEW